MSMQLLTNKETEVAKLVGEGLRNKEIAERMGIVPTTVQEHKCNIYDKLGLRSGPKLAVWAAKNLPCLMLLLVPALAAAQPAVTLTTTGPAFPGATLTISMNLTGSAGLNLAGIGFGAPTGTTSATIGAASTAAGKTLWTSGSNNVGVGFTNPPTGQGVASAGVYADGAIASFSFLVPSAAALGSTLSIALPMVQAANASGAPVAITTAPLVLTVGTSPACLSAINSNIAAYLALPSTGLLGQVVLELAAAKSTGTCQ